MFGRKRAARTAQTEEQIALGKKAFDEMSPLPGVDPAAHIQGLLGRPTRIQVLNSCLASQEPDFKRFADRFVRTYELMPVRYP